MDFPGLFIFSIVPSVHDKFTFCSHWSDQAALTQIANWSLHVNKTLMYLALYCVASHYTRFSDGKSPFKIMEKKKPAPSVLDVHVLSVSCIASWVQELVRSDWVHLLREVRNLEMAG